MHAFFEASGSWSIFILITAVILYWFVGLPITGILVRIFGDEHDREPWRASLVWFWPFLVFLGILFLLGLLIAKAVEKLRIVEFAQWCLCGFRKLR